MQIYEYTLDLLIDKLYDPSPKICVVIASSLYIYSHIDNNICYICIIYVPYIRVCTHMCEMHTLLQKHPPETRCAWCERWMWRAEWVQLPVLTKSEAYGFLPPWCAWVSERVLRFPEMSFYSHAPPGRYFVCHRKLRCLHSH